MSKVEQVAPKVISTDGAVVGVVIDVHEHPNAQIIWLAKVWLGSGDPVQVVFGGQYVLSPGDLVPAAPPGSWVTIEYAGLAPRRKKMRRRQYRGERSHGMLCSLVELGWSLACPDEVARLRDLSPGDELKEIPAGWRVDAVTPQLVPYVTATTTCAMSGETAATGGK